MTDVIDRIGTQNERFTLSDAVALDDLRHVLTEGAPEILGLTEWGPNRNHLLNKLGGHWKWTRPKGDGSPVVYNSSRYTLLSCRPKTLVGRGFVGRLPGRKSTLPPSVATVALFEDEVLDETVAVVVIHLTAEVQVGKGYRKTRSHARRVARHLAERARLKVLVVRLRARKRRVYVVGDTNYNGMSLAPLTSCWKGRRGGTLGHRAVDIIYSQSEARSVQTIPTRSDHRAVVATYRRN